MSSAEALGLVILAALVLYALLGGADFGGGILDALASGARKREQRALIEQAIGPIWEVNHIWLVLVIVLLFACFPPAFAAVSVSLFAPLCVFLVGIVLRGAAFTFRAYDYPNDLVQQRWGRLFSLGSTVAPLMLGTIVGALASGRLHFADGVFVGGFLAPWLSPFPLVVGLFAVALFTFISAVYLTVEAQEEVANDFRLRAIGAGLAVFGLAALSAALSYKEAPIVFHGLTGQPWSVPLHLGTATAAITAFVALWTRRYHLARLAAALQVALIVIGWGASQAPYLIVPDFTLFAASGPAVTQVLVLWALGLGSLVLFPCLYLLLRVFKGERPFDIIDRR